MSSMKQQEELQSKSISSLVALTMANAIRSEKSMVHHVIQEPKSLDLNKLLVDKSENFYVLDKGAFGAGVFTVVRKNFNSEVREECS